MGSMRRGVWLVPAILGWVGAAAAGVGVEVDTATLNRLLGAVAANRFNLDLGAGNVVAVELHDLRVTGLAPAATAKERDTILTSVTLVAPQLGLRIPLRPRVVLGVVRENGASLLELRFDDAGLAVPLVGQINFARLAPPLRFPADNSFIIAGASGDVGVTSRLAGIQMGRETIRFEFDVDVPEADAP